ncbi:enoyl-CoA hydratase-related protein [Streptomyces sp. NPDC006990]|uniref:enoyl-CoA hydratase-related protein n=1 Tax=Streptomyces sp. NPDC006990 TaxID=3154481 RepID=UPI003452283A
MPCTKAFDRLRRDRALRAAVVTGAGERFFCAGWDLKAAAGGEAVDADHGPGGFAGLTELFELDKPVIAAVNGLALGGGFELARAADLIVADAHAEFALPEVKLGLIADCAGVLRLPRRLPRAGATELLLTGRRLGAVEAAGRGLVNEVAERPDTALERALALAHIMRATNLTVHIASLTRDAGRESAGIEERAQIVRTEAQVAGAREAEVKLETALAFHHAVRDDQERLAHGLGRLRDLSRGGGHAHCIEIARFMAGQPPAMNATARWIDGGQALRGRRNTLVQHRRATV